MKKKHLLSLILLTTAMNLQCSPMIKMKEEFQESIKERIHKVPALKQVWMMDNCPSCWNKSKSIPEGRILESPDECIKELLAARKRLQLPDEQELYDLATGWIYTHFRFLLDKERDREMVHELFELLQEHDLKLNKMYEIASKAEEKFEELSE